MTLPIPDYPVENQPAVEVAALPSGGGESARPVIDLLSPLPEPVVQGGFLNLFATVRGGSSGRPVTQVVFYRESNDIPGLQTTGTADTWLGLDETGENAWRWAGFTEDLAPGDHTFYARAADGREWSDAVAATVRVEPAETWIPYLPFQHTTSVALQRGADGWTALVAFQFSSSVFRVTDWGQVTELPGNVFVIDAELEWWTGGAFTVLTHASHTYSLGAADADNVTVRIQSRGKVIREVDVTNADLPGFPLDTFVVIESNESPPVVLLPPKFPVGSELIGPVRRRSPVTLPKADARGAFGREGSARSERFELVDALGAATARASGPNARGFVNLRAGRR